MTLDHSPRFTGIHCSPKERQQVAFLLRKSVGQLLELVPIKPEMHTKGDQHTFHSLKLLKAQTINALTGLPDKALTSQVFVLQLAMDKDTLDRHLITSTFVKDGLLRLNSTKVDNATQWIPLKPFKSQSV